MTGLKVINSHKAILEIVFESKSTEQVKKELYKKYNIHYTSRYVRQHLKDMITINLVKQVVVVISDRRIRYYQRKENDE